VIGGVAIAGIAIAVVATRGQGAAKGSAAADAAVAVAQPAALDAAPQPTTPSTGVAECDQVAALHAKIEACKTFPDNLRADVKSMVDNQLGALTGSPPPNYVEYVRPKCASTADYFTDLLARYGCGDRRRAQAAGYSIPLADRWKETKERGQLPNELIVVEEMPAIGHSTTAGMFIEVQPYAPDRDYTTDETCQKLGRGVAANQGATFDSAQVVQMKVGSACANFVHDAEERRLGLSIVVGKQHVVGATCSYGLAEKQPPEECIGMLNELAFE